MQIQINYVNLDTLRNALLDHGFGLDGTKASDEILLAANVWTNVYGENREPGGFCVGQIRRELGSFPRFSLILDSGRINADRMLKVLSQITIKECR